jgi:hypothetical protein
MENREKADIIGDKPEGQIEQNAGEHEADEQDNGGIENPQRLKALRGKVD